MPSHSSMVLIVEDDEYKLEALKRFILEVDSAISIVTAQSLTTAIAALGKNDIWFAIIDMSLPTYELASNLVDLDAGQAFGGEDILRFIKAQKKGTFSVVVTQYDEFLALERALTEVLGASFLGVIHYSGQQGEWRNQLSIALQKARAQQ
jgi:ActR/RegA family two-component response regulator